MKFATFAWVSLSTILASTSAFAAEDSGCAQDDVVLVYADGIKHFSKQQADVNRIRAELAPFFENFSPHKPNSNDHYAIPYEGINPFRWNDDVGVIFAGRFKSERCSAGAIAVNRALRAKLGQLSRDLRSVKFKLFYDNEARYYSEHVCDSGAYEYTGVFSPINRDRRYKMFGFLTNCLRPGTGVGSFSWNSDEDFETVVLLPFMADEKWCNSAADMEAERARLAASCPNVSSILLEKRVISAAMWSIELGLMR